LLLTSAGDAQILSSMRRGGILLVAGLLALAVSGCLDNEIRQNNEILQRQQTELNQMQSELAAMRVQAATPPYSTTTKPGACDRAVMKQATRKGGEHFAASDYAHALGYYQDAAAACPQSAQAQLNLARTYEAIGDREHALEHYRLAAQAPTANGDASQQARAAITRLNGASSIH
jgi:tetratricopeptide (TPR) repeat protein